MCDAICGIARRRLARRRSATNKLLRCVGLVVLPFLLSLGTAFGADNIHWTITGPTSVTFDWRGSDSTIFYGLTTSYGQSVAAVSQAGMTCDPAAVPGNSSSGPYKEARITGLAANTVYHYKIGSSGADHTFRSAPSPGTSGFNVMVEADIGNADYYPEVGSIQDMIAANLPRMVIVVGDLTYKNAHDEDNDIQHFNDVMVWSQDAAYMPAWGNHEWDDDSYDDMRNYKGRFDFANPQTSPSTPTISNCGEDWYWFDYGNTRFIAYPEPTSPTGGSSSSGAWTDWYNKMTSGSGPMATAQSNANIRFIVTFGHRPAYSSGHHAGESQLKGYLDTLGCTYSKYVLNLNAHSHNYERSYPQKGSSCSNPAAAGVVHLTVGTGGATLEGDGTCGWAICTQPSWSAARYMRLGVMKLSFSASAIGGEFLCGPGTGDGEPDIDCEEGAVIDSFSVPPNSCSGAPNGTVCNDGNACTQTDTCQGGVCTGSNPVVCTASDPCHTAGTCTPATGVCTNPAKANGTACSDANACTQTDTCQTGACTGSNPVVCTASDQCHTAGTCTPATGVCTNPAKANGTACSDANACTQTDTCQTGVCTGSSPVVCTASDPCHDVGTCTPATGVCTNPAKANGTTCSDGNACTQTDTCQTGVCTGSNPVVCTASDPCHTAGTCTPATGVCTNPAKANGTTCSDGNACTQTDTCQTGVCTGSNPASNGTVCNDANACTQTDTCQSGVCTGSNPVVCTASDQCHTAGTCTPATGVCSNPAKSNGTACGDGSACTQTDTCQSGVCTGSNPVVCTASDPCHDVGTCTPATGVCTNPAKANGTTCSDGNACTQPDTCQAGVCAGGSPVVCTASDACHDAGTCTPATGCSNPAKANGTVCTDGSLCTQTDTCQSGVCTGSNPVVCTASDQCHLAGTCTPATGICSNPVKANGTACNDGNACTQTDACQSGVCTGSNPAGCTADNVHWTVTGPTSVTFDWRGTDLTLFYGPTAAYGQSVTAVSQAGLTCDPAAVPGNSSSGPYKEARITGLLANSVYHYRVGSGGADHTFRTAPSAGSSGFSVMAQGNIGNAAYYPEVAGVQGLIAGDIPRFVLVLGDLTYKNSHGSTNDIQHFNDVMVWSQEAAYMPAWGNAEWDGPTYDDLRNYKGRFDFANPQTASRTPNVSNCGEDWYWFDYGNTRFIAYPEPTPLTGSSSDYTAWTDWYTRMVAGGGPMATAQSDANIRFIVTYGHRPAYSSGHATGDSQLKSYLDTLACTYSKYVLNLAADSSDYERSNPQKGASCANAAAPGVVHLTVGTGGSTLEQDGACLWLTCTKPTWSAVRFMRLGAMKLTFSPNAIAGSFLCGPAGGGTNDISCTQGAAIDTFTLPPGQCDGAPNGTTCNDGNACTQTDTCQSGACTGTNPVVCTASDPCHDVGTCTPATGICSNPAKANGATCSDGNACTQSDTCQSGVCAGANPVVCTASDQCHTAGTCTPGTGICSNPAKANGTSCSDGNACTQSDTCQSGLCTGANPVVCTASDQCHDVGTCTPATGVCSNPAKANGATCSDGNACTQTDTCQSGVCTGANPVVCTASDQCHDVGTCTPATGVCTNPAKAERNLVQRRQRLHAERHLSERAVHRGQSGRVHGERSVPRRRDVHTCNGGLLESRESQRNVMQRRQRLHAERHVSERAVHRGESGRVHGERSMPRRRDVHTCNGTLLEPCESERSDVQRRQRLHADRHLSERAVHRGESGRVHGERPVPRRRDVHTRNGSLLESRESQRNVVQRRQRVHADRHLSERRCAPARTPSSARRAINATTWGRARPATGICSNPAKANGTACSDGNACTQTDTCQSGVCTGANPVVCTASDQCHDVGTCTPATGVCSNPAKAERNGVQRRQRLHADRHVSERRVHRRESGRVHGERSVPRRRDVHAGNGSLLESRESQRNGMQRRQRVHADRHLSERPVHRGESRRVHGERSVPRRRDVHTCNGGVLESREGQRNVVQRRQRVHANRHVSERRCAPGANPVVCTASDPCHDVGTCTPATGLCSNPAKANGTSCSDGNACTQSDTCQSGLCTGANPVVCTASDQCHDVGTCTPATGVCTNPAKANGTSCSDGNACTQTDTCQTGVCTGANPVVCTASDQCHLAGACDTVTGTCSNPVTANGATCSDGNACTQTDTCQSGACTGANPVVCTASDQCHDVGTCTPATGVCSNPRKRTERRATTGTRAPRPTRVRPACAPGRIPSCARRATSATTWGRATRQRALLEPGEAERHDVQRRERVHADRHVPERRCAPARIPSCARRATSATT